MATEEFKIKGMVCHSCEKVIEHSIKKLKGIEEVKVDYKAGTAKITHNEQATKEEIQKAIEVAGYKLDDGKSSWLAFALTVLGILVAVYFLIQFTDRFPLPEISKNMGYGLLLVLGILTGFHCIAMCGGFVVAYTSKTVENKQSIHKAHLFYAVGKTLSYTLIGAAFGLLGSIIAFTPTIRAVAGILSGLFLIIFGIKMLNIFPSLKAFTIKTPSFISKFTSSHSNSSPLMMGLLNGLMIACGPLQAVYIMAAGSGAALEGAKLLFIFALGTLPVMIGFAYLTSTFLSKYTQKIVKASAVIVIVLGLIMINTGLSLSGSGYDIKSLTTKLTSGLGSYTGYAVLGNNNQDSVAQPNNIAVQKDGYQEIRMDVIGSGYDPNTFVLKKGVPVKWIINGKQLTGCNKGIQVPSLNLKFDIKPGEQIIEFTPEKSGLISWSCWMGMIRGSFIVKDDITDQTAIKKEIQANPTPKGASCGGGGGCGCGM